MTPLARFPLADRRAIVGLFADIDDTISTDGKLTAEAYSALEALKNAGFLVVPVTGRPAGWCDHVARFWPVDAVVGENGAFWMWLDKEQRRLRTRHVQDDATRAQGRRRLDAVRADVAREVPGAGIASDQAYRVADLAIDFREDVTPLPDADIARIVAIFERHGATAKVSSIHVNGWFGDYDKLTSTRLMMAELYGIDLEAGRSRYVFVGDSPNDSPMFSFFQNAVGVANVVDFAGKVQTLPRWVTRARSGAGFAELAGALLAAQQGC